MIVMSFLEFTRSKLNKCSFSCSRLLQVLAPTTQGWLACWGAFQICGKDSEQKLLASSRIYSHDQRRQSTANRCRQLAAYYAKDPNALFMVRIAQGGLHQVFASLCHPCSIAAALQNSMAVLDIIFWNHFWLLWPMVWHGQRISGLTLLLVFLRIQDQLY